MADDSKLAEERSGDAGVTAANGKMENAINPQPSNLVAVYSNGRLDVKKLVQHNLAPFAIRKEFSAAIAAAEAVKARYARNAAGELTALYPDWRPHWKRFREEAIRLCELLPDLDKTEGALDVLDKALNTVPEKSTVRLLLGTMLDGFPSKPGEGAPVYIDLLELMLEESDTTEPNPKLPRFVTAPVIAAAARDALLNLTFLPSIHEFIELCYKNWRRLVRIQEDVLMVETVHYNAIELSSWLDDLLETDDAEEERGKKPE
jgi:hypothetical protein